MDRDPQNERERLKEEYKEHYRKIRETKERLKKAQQKQKISDALHDMDKSSLFDTVDDFLGKIRSKVSNVEARLDVALDSLLSEQEDTVRKEEADEQLRKTQAKETLRQVKQEMGLLYTEIERQAEAIRVEKTIGREQAAGVESDAPQADAQGYADTSSKDTASEETASSAPKQGQPESGPKPGEQKPSKEQGK